MYIIQESHAIAYIIRIFTCIIHISKKHVFQPQGNLQDLVWLDLAYSIVKVEKKHYYVYQA